MMYNRSPSSPYLSVLRIPVISSLALNTLPSEISYTFHLSGPTRSKSTWVVFVVFGSRAVGGGFVPKPLRGTPTNPPPTALDPNTTNTTQVDFERVGPERWNVYEISDGSVLRAKLEITGILRTDKYGLDGDRLYIINNQPIQRMKVAENLIKKQKIPQKDTSRKDIYG